ncbi:MAG TPA: YdcH family protein [Polyangiaceae bacterium]|nr:YdcH family protein [Polyangiaceae bacterium]
MENMVSDRIRELVTRHRDLDLAVSRMGRRAYLTPQEQREVARLKKQKLMAKDQLTVLRRS